mgnify:CR=1 FL=1
MAIISPSMLSADYVNLERDIRALSDHGADFVHVDVMDGHFVPNISYGAVVMKSLLGKTKLPFDVHLMIETPDKFIPDFVTDNTEYIVVHAEACTHLHRTIQLIKSYGIKAGVALNPATSLHIRGTRNPSQHQTTPSTSSRSQRTEPELRWAPTMREVWATRWSGLRCNAGLRRASSTRCLRSARSSKSYPHR